MINNNMGAGSGANKVVKEFEASDLAEVLEQPTTCAPAPSDSMQSHADDLAVLLEGPTTMAPDSSQALKGPTGPASVSGGLQAPVSQGVAAGGAGARRAREARRVRDEGERSRSTEAAPRFEGPERRRHRERQPSAPERRWFVDQP